MVGYHLCNNRRLRLRKYRRTLKRERETEKEGINTTEGEKERNKKSEQTSRSINHGNWSRWQVQSRSANLKYVGRKNWFRRTCTVRRGSPFFSSLPSRWSVLFPLAFCNAVDTHDHSKELDDNEMEREEKENNLWFFLLPRWWNTSYDDWLFLRVAPILRLQEIQGREGGRRKRKEVEEKERGDLCARRKKAEEKRASDIREEGWANRANGQVAYLWRPYFRYMNWFPSKVRDAASFQFEMYREVSRRSPSTTRFARAHPSRALSYELNSIFLLLYEMNARFSARRATTGFIAKRWVGWHVNIWLP